MAVHSTLTGPQIAYQIVDSGAKLVVVSGPEQAQKLAGRGAELAGRHPVLFVRSLARKRSAASPIRHAGRASCRKSARPTVRAIQQRRSTKCSRTDLATILYTSGTTGEPKGRDAQPSQPGVATAEAVLKAFTVEPGDLRLCWLPLSHIFARTSDYYMWVAGGGELALATSRETIIADCQALQAHASNGVPYFFDKVHRYLQDNGLADKPGALQGHAGRSHEVVLRRRSRPARSRGRVLQPAAACCWCKATD